MKAFNEWLKKDFICSYWLDCINEDMTGEWFFKNNPLKERKAKFLIDITYNPKTKKCRFVLMHTMDSTDEFWNIKRLIADYDDQEQKHAEQYCDAMQEKFDMEQYFDAMQKKCDLEQSVYDDGRLTQEELRAAWLDPKNGGRYFL